MQQRLLVQSHRPAHFKSAKHNNRKRLRMICTVLAAVVAVMVLARF